MPQCPRAFVLCKRSSNSQIQPFDEILTAPVKRGVKDIEDLQHRLMDEMRDSISHDVKLSIEGLINAQKEMMLDQACIVREGIQELKAYSQSLQEQIKQVHEISKTQMDQARDAKHEHSSQLEEIKQDFTAHATLIQNQINQVNTAKQQEFDDTMTTWSGCWSKNFSAQLKILEDWEKKSTVELVDLVRMTDSTLLAENKALHHEIRLLKDCSKLELGPQPTDNLMLTHATELHVKELLLSLENKETCRKDEEKVSLQRLGEIRALQEAKEYDRRVIEQQQSELEAVTQQLSEVKSTLSWQQRKAASAHFWLGDDSSNIPAALDKTSLNKMNSDEDVMVFFTQ